jgi:hypothetical protein
MGRAILMRRFGLYLGILALSACLPATLTDDALHAKVLDATSGTGGPLCGNNVIDEGETCDDGNTDICDDCDKCQKRTTFDVKDAKSLAGVTTLGALQFDGKENWSIETWFLVRSAPQKLPMPFLAVGTPGGSDVSVGFSMGVTVMGANTVPYCSLKKLTDSTSLGQSVALNTWHHLRCVWNAKDGDMRAMVDNGALQNANKKLTKPAPGFDGNSWLLLGRVPVLNGATETFDGALDEVRAAMGPNVAATALSRRYGPETPETVALYHADPAQPLRYLPDATGNHLDADQITLQGTTPIKRDAVLSFVAEGCYGFSAANAQCLANPKPPWCP